MSTVPVPHATLVSSPIGVSLPGIVLLVGSLLVVGSMQSPQPPRHKRADFLATASWRDPFVPVSAYRCLEPLCSARCPFGRSPILWDDDGHLHTVISHRPNDEISFPYQYLIGGALPPDPWILTGLN